jgi:hypothetical protein
MVDILSLFWKISESSLRCDYLAPAISHTISVFSIRYDLISKDIHLIQKKANASEAGGYSNLVNRIWTI